MDLIKKYLGESFKKGDKVKVINKDDDEYGKTGTVYKVFKGKGQTVKIGSQVHSFNDDEIKKVNENILAQIGSIGKMSGQWGKRLGTFGTVLARALKDAGVEIHGIEADGKFGSEITVTFKGKKKKVKLDMNSTADSVVKKITTGR